MTKIKPKYLCQQRFPKKNITIIQIFYFLEKKAGPLSSLSWCYKKDKHPHHIISTSQCPIQIKQWYKKRRIIETLFSDKKSRGFKLDKSHISDTIRIGRLMIATCLSYVWLVLLGDFAKSLELNKEFHRIERCDLSLLQLGFSLIEYMLKNDFLIPEMRFLQGNLLCVR